VKIWFGVAAAGAAGSVLRYAIGLAFARLPLAFPLGTLLVNVLGAFLIGLFARWLSAPALDPAWRIAVTVGFCGGFTTFSTFSAELITMAQEGRLARAAAYVVVSVSLAVIATLLGLALGERMLMSART
jgi:CrcB protein